MSMEIEMVIDIASGPASKKVINDLKNMGSKVCLKIGPKKTIIGVKSNSDGKEIMGILGNTKIMRFSYKAVSHDFC